ncbi:MAG TPA: LapA family protein [Alphaproteobacteria bacterium]|jgi:uncharacterized integral membrane protein|nr:LapA family protein [Alphaproteobacteria bacterium]
MRQSVRILSWIVAAPIVILVLWFALSNLNAITLRLWPLPFDLTIPIAFLTLIQLFIGFLLGAIVTWIGDRHRRRENKRLNRRTAELEQSLAEAERQLTATRAQPVQTAA